MLVCALWLLGLRHLVLRLRRLRFRLLRLLCCRHQYAVLLGDFFPAVGDLPVTGVCNGVQECLVVQHLPVVFPRGDPHAQDCWLTQQGRASYRRLTCDRTFFFTFFSLKRCFFFFS